MQITLRCNQCNTVFKIEIIEGAVDVNKEYHACCVACGSTGYTALEEKKQDINPAFLFLNFI